MESGKSEYKSPVDFLYWPTHLNSEMVRFFTAVSSFLEQTLKQISVLSLSKALWVPHTTVFGKKKSALCTTPVAVKQFRSTTQIATCWALQREIRRGWRAGSAQVQAVRWDCPHLQAAGCRLHQIFCLLLQAESLQSSWEGVALWGNWRAVIRLVIVINIWFFVHVWLCSSGIAFIILGVSECTMTGVFFLTDSI